MMIFPAIYKPYIHWLIDDVRVKHGELCSITDGLQHKS